MTPLLTLIQDLIIIGFIVYLFNRYVGPKIVPVAVDIINFLVAVWMILLVTNYFGVTHVHLQ